MDDYFMEIIYRQLREESEGLGDVGLPPTSRVF